VGCGVLEARAWGVEAERGLSFGAGQPARAREVRAWLLSAFEDAAIGTALIDLDPAANTRVLRVNSALCQLTGRSRQELEGSDIAAIVFPDDRDEVRTAMARLATGEVTGVRLEERLIGAGGQPVWVVLSASVGRNGDGRPAYGIWQLLDIEERKRFEGELGYLADHDPLTGLLNRRGFARALTDRITHARRYGGGGAVLFLDIDDFKYVNDTFGHSAGDETIVSVARVIEQRVRETDAHARLGGDEFGVLLPSATLAEAEALAVRLLEAVRDLNPLALPSGRHLTASIGLAVFAEASGEMSADDLLIDSDVAMYAAKESGKDRYTVAASAEPSRRGTRVPWTDRVRRALAQDGFELHCQPIVDLQTGAIAQWELLLRLPGDDDELILPAQFLYSAERSGAIVDIDQWVLREAMRLVAAHRDHGRALTLTVNISGRSVADPALPGFIKANLQRTGIDPSSLVIEVTETAAIANLNHAVKFAATLGALGCRLSLDDFGAGFGSFCNLKYIPFDFVKIDREFIHQLPSSPTDQVILDSIVQMSRSLGKRTIAEFAGDQPTVEILRDRGVDFAQGFHLGRPSPVSSALHP
jgi:diguanylate cyclase (GGDEF)-like protein/PAS domain S-box-containing protein